MCFTIYYIYSHSLLPFFQYVSQGRQSMCVTRGCVKTRCAFPILMPCVVLTPVVVALLSLLMSSTLP